MYLCRCPFNVYQSRLCVGVKPLTYEINLDQEATLRPLDIFTKELWKTFRVCLSASHRHLQSQLKKPKCSLKNISHTFFNIYLVFKITCPNPTILKGIVAFPFRKVVEIRYTSFSQILVDGPGLVFGIENTLQLSFEGTENELFSHNVDEVRFCGNT